MTRQRNWLIAGLALVLLVAAGIGSALATSESPAVSNHAETEDDEARESAEDAAQDEAEGEDRPIADKTSREKASRIALAWLQREHGTSGTVTATEVGDEESYYEVEVTLADGRHVDVQLTRDFEVVGLD